MRHPLGTYLVTTQPSLFGGWAGIGLRIHDHNKRAVALGKLLRSAYRVVRPEDDVKHQGAYTPSTRDEAERARSFLLSALLDTPGCVAQQLLMQLSREPEFRHFPDRLRYLARERAAKDAEFEAWSTTAVKDLDQILEMPPQNRDGLFRVMMDRLGDLQHHLSHDDFTDRRLLQIIHEEHDMQRVVAHKLKESAHGAYTVTREEEVADAKEPDIRLLTKPGGAKAAIEIKIADKRWSLKDLEKALKVQLTKQYLRHNDCRAGCLLLTYDGVRKSWPTARRGKRLTFVQLIEYLNGKAAEIELAQSGQVKVAVFGLDLTDPLNAASPTPAKHPVIRSRRSKQPARKTQRGA